MPSSTAQLLCQASILRRTAASTATKRFQSTSLRHVPSHIERPEYFLTGQPRESPRSTHIFDEHEIPYMREAAVMARYILDFACSQAVAGRSTDEVDALAHAEMVRKGVCPSPLNYHGFPKSICTSLNRVACHGEYSSYNVCRHLKRLHDLAQACDIKYVFGE